MNAQSAARLLLPLALVLCAATASAQSIGLIGPAEINAHSDPSDLTGHSGPIDLTGHWAARNHEDILDGVLPGDYMGMPINDAARARADAWEASNQSLPDHQCIMYTTWDMMIGPQPLTISADVDPISGRVIDWKMTGAVDRAPRTIWMDGRPQPSKYDRHTSAGFSTGKWRGRTLAVHTTHLAEGLIGRNGVPSSNEATINEYIARHGNTLRITMFLYDPVYFEAPYVRSKMWVLDPTAQTPPQPCEPAVEFPIPPGEVPSYLPGTNPALTETTRKFGIPLEAVRGGVRTTYPDYQARLKQLENSMSRKKIK
jgi:hypothetical protein